MPLLLKSSVKQTSSGKPEASTIRVARLVAARPPQSRGWVTLDQAVQVPPHLMEMAARGVLEGPRQEWYATSALLAWFEEKTRV